MGDATANAGHRNQTADRPWLGLVGSTHRINQIIDGGGLPSWAAKFHGERKAFRQRVEDGERGMAGVCTRCYGRKPTQCWVGTATKFDDALVECHFRQARDGATAVREVDLMSPSAISVPAELQAGLRGRLPRVGRKRQDGGFELWADVMAGDEKAQAHMRRYNIADTKLVRRYSTS